MHLQVESRQFNSVKGGPIRYKIFDPAFTVLLISGYSHEGLNLGDNNMRTKMVSWVVASVLVCFSCFAISHGWTEFPKARQIFCAEDGGYWHPSDGSAIPNAAYRAVFLESGTYPFVQKMSFPPMWQTIMMIHLFKP